jgi:hypothetical protein
MMGDMAEPWKSMRIERQNQVASGQRVSMKYRTEADREWGRKTAYEAVAMVDKGTLKVLKRLGLSPVHKGMASFQITLNGRIGMYYNGKNGQQIRWNDGEVVKLPYNGLEDFVKQTNSSKGRTVEL